MAVFYAASLGLLALSAGLPPAEFAFGFVEDAALPLAGATAKLGIAALCLAVVAAFGRWCQSQARLRAETPLLSRMPRSVASNLTLNLSFKFPRCISHLALAIHLPLHTRSRALSSTPADLSGADPLLL